MTSFGAQLGFSKSFCSISFSLINGCLIESALCLDVLCSRFTIGRDLLSVTIGGSLAVSAYNKILVFSQFLTNDKRKTNEALASKSKASYCETK